MTHLIGLAGRMGAGKDAVADILVDTAGYKKFGFAYSLRDEVTEIIQSRQCPEDYPEDLRELASRYFGHPEKVWEKPTEPDMRVLLQHHGTEYRRARDNDYWVKRTLDAIFMLPRVVLTDVRFPNEYTAVKDDGGEIWLIHRDEVSNAFNQGHVSEYFVKTLNSGNVDRVIHNDGTLADLYRTVVAAVAEDACRTSLTQS